MDTLAITHYVPAHVYGANDGDNDTRASYAPGHDATLIPLLGARASMVAVTVEGPVTYEGGYAYVWQDGDYGMPVADLVASPYFGRMTRNGREVARA